MIKKKDFEKVMLGRTMKQKRAARKAEKQQLKDIERILKNRLKNYNPFSGPIIYPSTLYSSVLFSLKKRGFKVVPLESDPSKTCIDI